MINDYLFLYQIIRIVSILLTFLIAFLVLKKRSDYVLNKLISLSFLLFSLGFAIELITILVSSDLKEETSYLMACIVLFITSAIYIIFIVSYALMSGENAIKQPKFILISYGPFIVLWLGAIFTNSFIFREVIQNSSSYWLFEPNPIGTVTVLAPTTIYLLLAVYNLLRVYRISPSDVRPMVRQFTFGVTFAVCFGLIIAFSVFILNQSDEVQFIGQTFRPLGIVIGGLFIANSFLQSNA